MKYDTNHTFAICAYKESVYLEECIRSVTQQSVKTNVILCTATPNTHIKNLCKQYGIPLYVNTGEHGITQDWNYAYKMAETDMVTIAHQDDIYDKDYVKIMLKKVKQAGTPVLFFTDYGEIRDGEKVYKNKLLFIKRIMLSPLRIRLFWNSKFIRRRILSLGSPICCPSATYVKDNCPEVVFQHGFRADEDWQAWEVLSHCKGAFVYCSKPLTLHRIHEDSETTKILGDNARTEEDYIMFCKFWPPAIAKILTKLYGNSEKSNTLF